MTGTFENMLLRSEGLTDDDIAKLNERLPDVQNLISVFESHLPQITRVVNDLGPIIQKVITKQEELK